MTMESPNESTIVYRVERGTDERPDDPSRLILVDSGDSGGNVISCDEGCTCKIVNEDVSGCGIKAKPTESSPAQANCSAMMGAFSFLAPCLLLVWAVLK